MASKLDPATIEFIKGEYAKGATPAQIKKQLEERGLYVPRSTIIYYSPNTQETKKQYYSKPEVRKRRSALHKLTTVILQVFDKEIMSLDELCEKIKEETGVEFTKNLPQIVERRINKLQEMLGNQTPIIFSEELNAYVLNQQSPYYVVCGK